MDLGEEGVEAVHLLPLLYEGVVLFVFVVIV